MGIEAIIESHMDQVTPVNSLGIPMIMISHITSMKTIKKSATPGGSTQ
jgi:hypothetical protein